jgi:hypothetical protein
MLPPGEATRSQQIHTGQVKALFKALSKLNLSTTVRCSAFMRDFILSLLGSSTSELTEQIGGLIDAG